jgi:glutathione S-transferase
MVVFRPAIPPRNHYHQGMRYILHYAPDNASLIVRLALEHRGLPYETALVDRSRTAQRSAAYLALNPNGLIPVLETPDGPIFETAAILLWLADTHGGLFPSPQDSARGRALKWLFYLSNTLHPLERMLFYPEKYIAAPHQAALREGLQRQLTAGFATLDAAAAEWRCADTPGILDFYTAALLRWPALYPRDANRSWFRLANTPALRDCALRVEQLPSCAALQRAEGLGTTPFSAPHDPNPPEGSAT